MFTYGFPFGIPVERDSAGGYQIKPTFNLILRLDGDALTGTFGNGRLPLQLTRGGSFGPKPAAPQHPAAPDPLWSFAMGAGTWAPPVAADGIVYIGTSAGKFHAVNAADGKGRWTWTGPAGIDGRAVVGGNSVYFVDTRPALVALDRARGIERWSVALHDENLAGRPSSENPTFNHRAAYPLLLDGVLYVGSSDGGLYALDAATGARLWRHDARAPVYSGVGLYEADTLTFGTMDGSVVFLHRRTREETLRAKTGGGVVTTPVVVGGKVIVGSRDYQLYAFNLADGGIAWRFSYWFSWIESTPVVRDGLVYVGASDYRRVTAIDPAAGRAKWATEVPGMNWGSPLLTDDTVFTGTVSQNVPGTVIEHRGGLMAMDRRTGAVKWWLAAPQPVVGAFGGYAGTLALVDGKVIAAGFDGILVALPTK
ncbi:MAG: PQQ-like beta-propeller repeat protein [Verrucomicrobia bacterium]|nr:PQQ-like beta-propeller repeat protein [Verrucomicrobiota bacterium]